MASSRRICSERPLIRLGNKRTTLLLAVLYLCFSAWHLFEQDILQQKTKLRYGPASLNGSCNIKLDCLTIKPVIPLPVTLQSLKIIFKNHSVEKIEEKPLKSQLTDISVDTEEFMMLKTSAAEMSVLKVLLPLLEKSQDGTIRI